MTPPTKADLREAWRDATRAAELAERLAGLAAAAAEDSEAMAASSEELAMMAEATSEAAARAAVTARVASERARARANLNRDDRVPKAGRAIDDAREAETAARAAYHAHGSQVRDSR